MLTFGSLFSGIGGIDLGLERAGMRCLWQSEIDPYASAVLRKHWPGVPNLGDIRTITEAPSVDLICGGVPCQPWSVAGKRAGNADARDLWPDFWRVCLLVRPRYILVEEVPGFALPGGLGRALSDLAGAGYSAEWFHLSAADVGAPHLRKRLWIVAYTYRRRSHAESQPIARSETKVNARGYGASQYVADSDIEGLAIRQGEPGYDGAERTATIRAGRWLPEPCVGRVANGVSSRVDRLRCLGNAVVPQVAQVIGERIVAHDAARRAEQ